MSTYEDINLLRLHAMTFDDVQRIRIAVSNRAGAIDQSTADGVSEHLAHAEAMLRASVRASYRHVVSPGVQAWQRSTKGVGEHLLALLLAEIGDPAVAHPLDKDGEYTADPYWRTVEDLWAYCGLVPGRKRRKGMNGDEAKAMGNPAAKRHLYLLAESQLKTSGPYRPLYDSEKAKALGKGWPKAHAHAHGLRMVSKRLLRDLHRARMAEVE